MAALDIQAERLARFCAGCQAEGLAVQAYPVDMRHSQAIAAVVDQIEAEQSRMSAPLTPEQALRLWVRKEAVLKAPGRGLSLPMSQIAVPPRQSARLRAVSECDSQLALWHLYDLDAGPGAQAALACRSHQASLKINLWL